MFYAPESFQFRGLSAASQSFPLRGGRYGVQLCATWGGGTVALQRMSADGQTWVTVVTAFTANGYASADLLPGTYQFAVTTATAVCAEIGSIAIVDPLLFAGARP